MGTEHSKRESYPLSTPPWHVGDRIKNDVHGWAFGLVDKWPLGVPESYIGNPDSHSGCNVLPSFLLILILRGSGKWLNYLDLVTRVGAGLEFEVAGFNLAQFLVFAVICRVNHRREISLCASVSLHFK